MNKSQLQVKEFHEAFGVPVHTTPQVTISKERALLRAKLIFEEAKETIEAMGMRIESYLDIDDDGKATTDYHVTEESDNFNLVEVADGLADLIYVINGAALEFGIDLEPVLDCVHASNMSKMWTQSEWQEEVIDGRVEREGLTATSDDSLIPAYCVKRADGKVIKSTSYSPANIAAVLEKQNGF